MSDATLTSDQIAAENLTDWRPLLNALHTRLLTGNFATGLALANQIGDAAEAANHHPDLDLRYPHLNIKLFSHDAGGITQRDIALAHKISELAARFGVQADPSSVTAIELALDTPDFARIKPFWLAVMGYKANPNADDEVRNDNGALPTIWFQTSESQEPRQRFHIDVRVPKEVQRQRIDAAVAAGGTVVTEASSFVTLADQDGNRVCVCV